MALKIYNSFTKQKEVFKPIHEGMVGMYVCGPTVYGPPHLGHARSYTNFDVIFRYLQFLGYKVKYVQNITDVGHLVGDGDDGEDKILKQAREIIKCLEEGKTYPDGNESLSNEAYLEKVQIEKNKQEKTNAKQKNIGKKQK